MELHDKDEWVESHLIFRCPCGELTDSSFCMKCNIEVFIKIVKELHGTS